MWMHGTVSALIDVGTSMITFGAACFTNFRIFTGACFVIRIKAETILTLSHENSFLDADNLVGKIYHEVLLFDGFINVWFYSKNDVSSWCFCVACKRDGHVCFAAFQVFVDAAYGFDYLCCFMEITMFIDII